MILIAVFIVSAVVFFRIEIGSATGFVDLTLFGNTTYSGATLSNFLLNGAAGTLLVTLTLVQQEAGLSSLQSGLLTAGYLIAILSTIRVGEKLLQKMGPRKPMLIGCWITAAGILLTTFTFLLARRISRRRLRRIHTVRHRTGTLRDPVHRRSPVQCSAGQGGIGLRHLQDGLVARRGLRGRDFCGDLRWA